PWVAKCFFAPQLSMNSYWIFHSLCPLKSLPLVVYFYLCVHRSPETERGFDSCSPTLVGKQGGSIQAEKD
ncbi:MULTISPECIES: hypothetical protein, partial [Nostoc]|uniref:hypothetical protein n=1 Tax=Nostoc TaxID=1177 RepID=UPI001A7F0691